MDWLEFISAIVKAIAWPTVVVVAIVFFYEPVGLVIRSLRSLKFRETELRFEKKLDKVEEASALLRPEAESDIPPARMLTKQSAATSESPEEQITHHWYAVRSAIWELAKRCGLTSADRLKPLMSIKWLEENEVIDSTTARILRELRQLRGMVRSGQGVLSIDSEQADRFAALSAQMISTLEAIKPLPGPKH